MPRKYTPKPGYKKMFNYAGENLEAALKAIHEGMSQREASLKFGIPRGTLQNKLKGKHNGYHGGQRVFTVEEETAFAHYLSVISDWGFPVDYMDLRFIVKNYLNKCNRQEPRFRNNLPSEDWARSFIKRHKAILTTRFCQNITTKRADVSVPELNKYFDNLEQTLQGVPCENILNYDETNLCDNPGKKRCIFRRGVKYPERILNATKASTSLMFACTGDGTMLPPYVVYRAKHLMNTWTEHGPNNTRYNRSKSGWFDAVCFTDWFNSVVLPWATRLPGRKVMIGDNLSSHFSEDCIKSCEEHNIAFVCLPPNSTHLTQPLDVCVFSSMKKRWRTVLTRWKEGEGRRFATLPKDSFPKLLKELMESTEPVMRENIISGFQKTGIYPINRRKVIDRLPNQTTGSPLDSSTHVSEVFMERLQTLRFGHGEPKPRRKRINVEPGKSISRDDMEIGPTPAKQSNAMTGVSTDQVCNLLTESDTESDSSASDTETVTEEVFTDSESEETTVNPEFDVTPGAWVVVQYTVRKRNLHYVGQILHDTNDFNNSSASHTTDQWDIRFLRKSKKSDAFIAPNVEDISCVHKDHVVRVLPDPTIRRQLHRFSVKFDGFNMQ